MLPTAEACRGSVSRLVGCFVSEFVVAVVTIFMEAGSSTWPGRELGYAWEEGQTLAALLSLFLSDLFLGSVDRDRSKHRRIQAGSKKNKQAPGSRFVCLVT